jgi:hypothetical protein
MKSWFDLTGQSASSVGGEFGLYYMMKGYASSLDMFNSIRFGTGYVFSLFPYILKATGIFGVIFFGIIIHLAYGGLSGLLLAAISEGRIVKLIVLMKIFIFYLAGFIEGFLWYFFGIRAIALFALLFIIHDAERAHLSRSASNPTV